MEGLQHASIESGLQVILPMHPRTKKNLNCFLIDVPERIRLVEPLGYLDFLQLESHARLLMTDSGGIQEEGCILGVPCVTLRESTERPETIEVGANVLAGLEQDEMVNAALTMLNKQGGWECPLGKGNAAAQILDVLAHHYDGPDR
jgi:UDP-N-acetylglucosamine 2-epimerase (non-hydrolysing)